MSDLSIEEQIEDAIAHPKSFWVAGNFRLVLSAAFFQTTKSLYPMGVFGAGQRIEDVASPFVT
jgi:hypothetical protein